MRSILIIAILVIAIAAPAMADEVIAGEVGTGGTETILNTYMATTGTSTATNALINHTIVNFDYKQPINAYYWISGKNSYNTFKWKTRPPVDIDGYYIDSAERTVGCFILNVSYGTARLGYQLAETGTADGWYDGDPESLMVYLNFNDDFKANTSGFAGPVLVELRDDSDPNWYKWGLNNLSFGGDATQFTLAQATGYLTSKPAVALLGGRFTSTTYFFASVAPSAGFPMQGIWGYYRYKFQNGYAVVYDPPEANFQITKQFGDDTYPSRVYVYNFTSGALQYSDPIIDIKPVDINLYTGGPFNLAILDYAGVWWNRSINFTSYQPWTPTTYGVSISPDPVGTGSTFSIRASSSAGWDNVDAYSLYFDYYDEFEVNDHEPIWMKRSDGHWYQYNEDTGLYDVDYGTGFPEMVTGSINTPGTYTLEAAFWETTGGGAKAHDTVTVAGTGVLVPITFRTKDYSSGSVVAPSTIHIRNLGNESWYNQTTSTGTYEFNAVIGQWYQWTGSATGYQESAPISNKFAVERTVDINLYATITVAAGNNTCWVQVSDTNLNLLSGAAVLLSDGQYKTTGTSGVVTFTVLEGATYQIDVSKSGYVSQTRTVQVVGTSNAFSFMLSKQYVTTVPTTAPGELPTVDTRTDDEKDQAMMDTIRLYGNDIILLAIVATILGLIGLMMKGLK